MPTVFRFSPHAWQKCWVISTGRLFVSFLLVVHNSPPTPPPKQRKCPYFRSTMILSVSVVLASWLLMCQQCPKCISGTDLPRQLHVLPYWEAADQTSNRTQSQFTDTGPISPSTDPIMPDAWQGRHQSTNISVTGMTEAGKRRIHPQTSTPPESIPRHWDGWVSLLPEVTGSLEHSECLSCGLRLLHSQLDLWMSGSFESMRWNACVHRLDLGLFSHPKEILGDGVRTHVNSKGKVPSTRKILPRGWLNPQRCFMQDNEPNILPMSYSSRSICEIASLICYLYLTVTTSQPVTADPSSRDTLHVAGTLHNHDTNPMVLSWEFWLLKGNSSRGDGERGRTNKAWWWSAECGGIIVFF